MMNISRVVFCLDPWVGKCDVIYEGSGRKGKKDERRKTKNGGGARLFENNNELAGAHASRKR